MTQRPATDQIDHPYRNRSSDKDAVGFAAILSTDDLALTTGVDAGRQRLDKWLWCARFYKSRTQAARLCADGLIRLNRMPVTKAAQMVKPGDVLTFSWGNRIRVVQVARLAERRGPAEEARGLYTDLRPVATAAPMLAETAAAPA